MLPDLSELELPGDIPPDTRATFTQRGRTRRFRPGDLLIRQGEPSETVFMLVRGRVRVERSHPDLLDPVVLAELGPGEIIGEMGVLNNSPRSASVVAVETTEAVELSTGVLYELLRQFPDASISLAQTLARRLREADDRLERAVRRRAEDAR